jgi:hypothetical protein
VGGAALVTGVIVIATGPSASTPRVALGLGPGTVGAALSGAW